MTVCKRAPKSIAASAMILLMTAGCGGEASDDAAPVGKTSSTEAPSSEPTQTVTSSAVAPTTSETAPTETPKETPAPETSATEEPPSDDPIVACANRKSNKGEILVRDTVGSDGPPTTYRLGGGWTWSFASEECITTTESAIRGSAPLPGYCTEVGRVAENVGYPEDAVPAPPLYSVVASTGDC